MEAAARAARWFRRAMIIAKKDVVTAAKRGSQASGRRMRRRAGSSSGPVWPDAQGSTMQRLRSVTPRLRMASCQRGSARTWLYAILRTAHTWLAWLLFVTFLLHLAAALFHALVRRDGVFASMAPCSTAASPNENVNRSGSTIT